MNIKEVLFLILSSLVVFSCNKDNEEPAGNDTDSNNNDTNSTINQFNSNLDYGEVSDNEGNVYKTIEIGDQIWMAENLRTTKYCNGDEITYVDKDGDWWPLQEGARAYYDDDLEKEEIYGQLYNWRAADDPRNICPCDWKVPSLEDWEELVNTLGGESITGVKLRSIGTIEDENGYWKAPNTANNSSGFSALPAGFRAILGNFIDESYVAKFWTSTEGNPDEEKAHSVELYGSNENVIFTDSRSQKHGYSVRCIKSD